MSKMRSITLNPDAEIAKLVSARIRENDGYCPCRVERTADTKCPCKPLRESGECICGLYVPADSSAEKEE